MDREPLCSEITRVLGFAGPRRFQASHTITPAQMPAAGYAAAIAPTRRNRAADMHSMMAPMLNTIRRCRTSSSHKYDQGERSGPPTRTEPS